MAKSTSSSDLTAIALTQEDINIITYSLRKLSKDAAFSTLRNDAAKLIIYIERVNKELNEK